MKAIGIVLILLISASVNAQININGVLKDNLGNTVSFASITTKNKLSGTISDINGNFSLQINRPDSIYIYYLGLKSVSFFATESLTKEIQMEAQSYNLSEVVVFPGINPADTIMQHVVAMSAKHNPSKLPSFKYMAYNKFSIEVNQDTLQSLINNGIQSPMLLSLLKFSEQSHLFISEAISENVYKRPGQVMENILTTNIAGFKDPAFGVLGNQLQSLSCYDKFFEIGNIKYVNPISENSWNRYLFLIQDTIYQNNGDKLFVITFRPKAGTSFNAMYGMVYINGADYAIKSITAQPASQSSQLGIEIKQEYEKIQGKYWFPKKLQTNLYFYVKADPTLGSIPMLNGHAKTEIINPQINIDIPKSILRRQFQISYDADAGKVNQNLFKKYRTDSLTFKDFNAFKFLDTAMQKSGLRFLQHLPKILAKGTIPTKYFDILLPEIFGYNLQEKMRLGLSVMTNEGILNWASVGGKIIYSTKEDTIRYAARIALNPLKSGILRLRYQYQSETAEKGNFEFYNPYKTGLMNYRKYVIPALNYVSGHELAIELEYPRNINSRIKTHYEDYQLSHTAIDTTFGDFSRSSVKYDIRFAPREKLSNMGKYRIRVSSRFPVFNFAWEKGFKNKTTDVRFEKYLASIRYNLQTKYTGTWRFLMQSGYVTGDIPLQFAFNGKGSAKMPIFEPGVFFTMPAYKFFHTKFTQAFMQYHLPIYQHRNDLMFSLSSQINIMYGQLNNNRLSTLTQPASKGYYEAGIMGGILSPDFGQIVLGTFYTLGAYTRKKQINNFAFILGFITNIDW